MVGAGTRDDFGVWKTRVVVSVVICLAGRIAPFPGNLRGSLAAIFLLGMAMAAIPSLFDLADPRVQSGWAVLNLTVATLLFLLMISLLIRGSVGLFQLLRRPT